MGSALKNVWQILFLWVKEEKWRANLQRGGWKKLHFRLFIMIWLWAVYQYFYVTKEVQEVM